jgi:acyl-coenzyme A thioesterase PaaI-like protein
LFRPSDASHLQDPSRHIPRVATLYALGGGTSGYEGILHGGLTATLFDESLSIVHELNTALKKSSSAFTSVSVTSSLNIRYLAPVDITEEAVCVVAEVKAILGREMTMHAELINSRGARLATAESVFVTVRA